MKKTPTKMAKKPARRPAPVTPGRAPSQPTRAAILAAKIAEIRERAERQAQARKDYLKMLSKAIKPYAYIRLMEDGTRHPLFHRRRPKLAQDIAATLHARGYRNVTGSALKSGTLVFNGTKAGVNQTFWVDEN